MNNVKYATVIIIVRNDAEYVRTVFVKYENHSLGNL